MHAFPRDVLNKLKWSVSEKEGNKSEKGGLRNVVVKYIHRGAKDNIASFKGEEIVKIDRGFVVIKRENAEQESYIPYHRIIEIEKRGKVIWKRK